MCSPLSTQSHLLNTQLAALFVTYTLSAAYCQSLTVQASDPAVLDKYHF